MKAIFIAIAVLATTAMGKPMPISVSSWEGDFPIGEKSTPIHIRGMPTLYFWIYKLPAGSKGTVIGFSNEEGDMILVPTPNEMGVQPIYTGHFVTVNADGTAYLIFTYSVQGNGGGQWVEKYRYNGESIVLENISLYSGKPTFDWRRKENQGEQGVPGYRRQSAPQPEP